MYVSKKGIAAITWALFLFAVWGCSSLQTTGTGGTGSETVIGCIIHEDGTPAGETVVSLYPEDFDPASKSSLSEYSTDTTDREGRYKITVTSPKSKRFTLQAVNMSQRTRTIIPNISFSSSIESTFVEVKTLHKTGSIKAVIPDSLISGEKYVYIPGTTYYSDVKNGQAIIDSVPAEMIPQVCFKNKNGSGESISLARSVDIEAGTATMITFSGLAYSRNVHLNTTAEGADIKENIIGFPLLIRLSDKNFNFNIARTDGSDVRFTNVNSSPLPFEIERWDATTQHAEIWVKVDTVYGNDSSHFIVMYWGEAATNIALNSAKVFDTTNGYRGVWHLAEEASGIGTKGLYKDATGQNHGDDYISQTDRTGIIGNGHAFDGIDDFIPLNSPVTNLLKGNCTIALWVNIHDSAGTILSKLDTQSGWNAGEASFYMGDGTDRHDSFGVNGMQPSFVGYQDDYAIAGQSIAADGWHYLVYTWEWNGDSSGTPRYYIDGEEISLSYNSLTIRIDESNSATVRIGQPNNNESYSYFNGAMDELEISAVVRSADWIKLCYMNQRKVNLLVKY